jgi:hypothetical protein
LKSSHLPLEAAVQAIARATSMYNLVSAAAAAGVTRSTVLRAIKAGRLSAQRTLLEDLSRANGRSASRAGRLAAGS